ncbi:hypothetical protein HMPREF9120_02741 [Neisseria sp. oral taxon 020 str. F0370]|nr:hypothetical protein HMPREF9120_02741 [Neisseria sp. oral taxon 020 str. F0370]
MRRASTAGRPPERKQERPSEQPFQTSFARSGCVMRPSESKVSKK